MNNKRKNLVGQKHNRLSSALIIMIIIIKRTVNGQRTRSRQIIGEITYHKLSMYRMLKYGIVIYNTNYRCNFT